MSITHCNAENEVDSSRAMSGSATLTMVTSSSSMKVPTQMDTSGNHFFMTTPRVSTDPTRTTIRPRCRHGTVTAVR